MIWSYKISKIEIIWERGSSYYPRVNLLKIKYEPFAWALFISLVVTVWILHNCKLDSEDAMNVMALEVPKKMDLKTSRPYRNVCEFDSREIPSVGLIKNLQVHLTAYPNVFIIIDIVVLDIRATRECCCHANGHQIWTHTNEFLIYYHPNSFCWDNYIVQRTFQWKPCWSPRKLENYFTCLEESMGSYTVLAAELAPRTKFT